jgi:ectoine hydroxylase
MQQELERIRNSEEVRQSELAVTEPLSGEIRSVFGVSTVSDLFERLARDERLVNIVRQLLGSEVYLYQSRVNFKPGFRGKEFYWHSDFETWHAEDGMPRMRAISCSIALTDNHEFNGPLMLIPGSHKYFVQCAGETPEDHYHQSLKKQDFGVPSDEQLEYLVQESGIVVPKGPAGSVVLFDCNTLHGSNGNITPFPRSNVFCVYNSVENALAEPFAAEERRPWFLGNREAAPLAPVNFHSECLQPA